MAIGYACGDSAPCRCSLASTRLLLLVTTPSPSRTLAEQRVCAIPQTAAPRSRYPIGDASRTPLLDVRTSGAVLPRASTSVRLLMPAGSTVLVIDSDESTQRLLQHTLRPRYTVLTASCWSQAREIRGRAAVDAMVVNVDLTSGEQPGLDTLCAEAGKTPFVLMAGSPDGSAVAHTRARPPSLFTIKPVQLGELPHTLNDVIANRRVEQEAPARTTEPEGILAESGAMRTVMGLIDRAAMSDTPVLLIGESGTGKELLARALHKNGRRAAGPVRRGELFSDPGHAP